MGGPMTWQERYTQLGVSGDDLKRLAAFVALVHELDQRRYFKMGSIGLLAEHDRTTGLDLVSDHGDAEDLRSALLSIRKLISDKEPTFTNRIVGILYRAEDSDDRRQLLTKSHDEIKRARREPAEAALGEMQPSGGWPIKAGRSRETLVRQLINTQLFHGDDPPPEPLPDMTGDRFADADLNSVLLRQSALELVLSEYEFASWLRGFIVESVPQ